MTHRAKFIRPIAFIAAATLALFASSGCQQQFKLLKSHFSLNREADARERWQNVRSRVKLQLAEQSFESRQTGEVRSQVREAIGLNPKDANAYLLLAKIELSDGRLGAAAEAVQTAESLVGSTPPVEYVAGVVAERYEHLDEALRHYRCASDANPRDPEYLLACGETLVALDRPMEALALLEPKLSDFDGDTGLHLLVAEIYQRLGMKSAAVNAYRDASRLCGDNAEIQESFGLALVWAGEYSEAVGILKPLVDGPAAPQADTSPDSPAATPEQESLRRRILGRDRTGLGSNAAGTGLATRRALARAYLGVGNNDEALTLLRRLLIDSRDDVESLRLLTRVGIAQSDLGLVQEAADRLSRLDNRDSETWLLLSYCMLKRGDSQGATTAAARALALNADDELGLCLLADAAKSRGNSAAASTILKRVLAVNPVSSIGHRLAEQWQLAVTPQPAAIDAAPAVESLPIDDCVSEPARPLPETPGGGR